MVRLKSKLKTKFHRHLANTKWVERVSELVATKLKLLGAKSEDTWAGELRSHFNSEEQMGPLSLCKYEFRVELALGKKLWGQSSGTYSASVKYVPETDSFQVSHEHFETEDTRRVRDLNRKMVDELARLIDSGECALDQVEQKQCLVCGGEVRIDFRSDGKVYILWCERDTCHFNKLYHVKELPRWWRERCGHWRYLRENNSSEPL